MVVKEMCSGFGASPRFARVWSDSFALLEQLVPEVGLENE